MSLEDMPPEMEYGIDDIPGLLDRIAHLETALRQLTEVAESDANSRTFRGAVHIASAAARAALDELG